MKDPVVGASLSISQQFQLKVLANDIEKIDDLEVAKKYLLESFRQMMVKDNLFKDLLKQGL